jgi:hypothetical protein
MLNKLKHNKISLLLFLLFLTSCKKEKLYPPPCPNGCESNQYLIYKNDTIQMNNDGFYRIKWEGLNYFQLKGNLSDLDPQYVINKVPLVVTNYDTDYWITNNGILFRTVQDKYLGWFYDDNFNTPVVIRNQTYTWKDAAKIYQPLNIAGYQIPKYFCFDCPYAPTIIGTSSAYTYEPTQNIRLNKEMIGDTLNVYTETCFNTDVGEREIKENSFNIIVE